uniref:Uncharacterized protein n=1 Tax=Strombidinopsis acuminata TaxID=141414 RepID=A0A7S3X9N3_9SPIT
MQQFSFVGNGVGSFEKEILTTYTGWRLKRPAMILLVAGVCALLIVVGVVVLGVTAPLPDDSSSTPMPAQTSFTCRVASANLESEWTAEKKAYCCEHHGLGCGAMGASAGAAPAAGMTMPASASPAATPQVAAPVAPMVAGEGASNQAEADGNTFDCTVGPQGTWSPAKKAFCAATLAQGSDCDIVCTYNGEAHSCKDRILWDATKGNTVVPTQQMCEAAVHDVLTAECPVCTKTCTLKLSGCLDGAAPARPAKPASSYPSMPFDCQAGLSNWEHDWSSGKQAWCCLNERRGCLEPDRYDCNDDTTSSTWSSAQRSWCCQKRGKGCLLSGDVTLRLARM